MNPYNYNPSSAVSSKVEKSTPRQVFGTVGFGRVVKVILDSTDPDYINYGADSSIGGIIYTPLGKKGEQFAYQYQTHFKTYPLPGEIVEIVGAPSEELSTVTTLSKLYYRNVVNIWNQGNNNFYPDIYNEIPEEIFTNQIENTKNLSPFPGDVILEGRDNQGIRFTSYPSGRNSFNPDNIPSPLTIISNGRRKAAEDSTIEDVNSDDSSIYLTSNHVVNLILGNKKRDSYLVPPIEPQFFKGKQVIINSDRVILNSKQENTLISSAKSVGINGETLNFDGNSSISMDASIINLGREPLNLPENLKQPAVLGRENKKFLQEIITSVDEIASTLVNLSTEPIQALAELRVLGTFLREELVLLREQVEKLNSRKVFIDSGR